jgi:glutathione S-transferase
MLTLYSMDGCPYAQRTQALLHRLNQPFEQRTIDPRNKPPDFLAVSPNGKVPLLLDGELKLYESFITNQYLAERLGWDLAHSSDTGQRARERLAMLQFDEVVVAEFFATFKTGELPAPDRQLILRNALVELERTALAAGGADNLLGIHCGVHWLRMQWLGEDGRVPLLAIVAEYPRLQAWLNETARLPSLVATQPEKASFVSRMRERFAKAS